MSSPAGNRPGLAPGAPPPGVPPPLLPCPNECMLWGQASLAGDRYGALNQDCVLTQQLHTSKAQQQCLATVVLDGHGMLGERAAQQAGQHILHALAHSELRHRQLGDLTSAEVEVLVGKAFAAGHAAALHVFDDAPHTYIFPLGSSYEQRYALQQRDNGDKVYFAPKIGGRLVEFGTSATLALVQGTALVVADVGDSLAVLGWQAGDSYEAEIVSVRHWGADPGEAARLARECGQRVSISHEDGYLCVEEGRLRGFQLAMTRALGHRLLSQYGVSAQPSVVFRQLGPQHLCLIVATDGVWEVLSPGAAVKMVADALAEGRSAEEAAHQMCAGAVRLAGGNNTVRQAGGEADNTTASVLVFSEL